MVMKKWVLACISENILFPIWYLKSPPYIRSRTRYNVSLSWKAQCILTKKGELSCDNSTLSFITLCTDFLVMTLMLLSNSYIDFSIYFMAYWLRVLICYTFHTLPKPPLPMMQSQQNSLRYSLKDEGKILVYSFIFVFVQDFFDRVAVGVVVEDEIKGEGFQVSFQERGRGWVEDFVVMLGWIVFRSRFFLS